MTISPTSTTWSGSPWIAVADRLPPAYLKVLTWGPWRYQIDQVDSNDQLGYGATHWMPLPEPPQ